MNLVSQVVLTHSAPVLAHSPVLLVIADGTPMAGHTLQGRIVPEFRPEYTLLILIVESVREG